MKYLIPILLFPVLAQANLRDTVPSGVPQLFGGKYYKFNGYILADSFIMNAPGDTNNIPYYPSLKFKSTDNTWYGYNRSRWLKFLTQTDFYNLNLQQVTDNGNTTTDTIQVGGIRTHTILPDTTSQADYEIEVFPDLQGMTLNHPDQLSGMFDWVISNRVSKNIKAVLTLGDLTDNNSSAEYTRLDTNFDKLDVVDIPYIGVIGNHDYNNLSSRITTNFNSLGMGESRYVGHSWKGNAFHNKAENFYIKFDVYNTKYLVVGMEYIPSDTALQWAGRVIDSFPDRKVIITTHAYITTFGERSTDTSEYSSIASGYGTAANSGVDLWNNLIRKKKNIFMVLGGHFINLGVGYDSLPYVKRFVDIGDNGNLIHQFLVNYQRVGGQGAIGPNPFENGGNGYFMRLRFSPSKAKVYASFYSSLFNQYDPLTDSFSLDQPGIEVLSSVGIEGKLTVGEETRLDSNVYISKFPKNRFVTTTFNGQLDTSTFFITDVVKNVNNGLSKDADSTKLGQNINQSGDPAALHADREIPLNGFDLRLKNIGRGATGIFKLYKDPGKSIAIPFIQFRDQRDSILANIGADSLFNVYMGSRSGQALTTGNMNTFMGYRAGWNVTTGLRNTLIGESAGAAISTGIRNAAFGARSLLNCTTGNENTALGTGLAALTTGNNNIGIGYLSAVSLSTGSFNIAMGGGSATTSPLERNVSGNRNVAIGTGTLGEVGVTTSNFSGSIAIGINAGRTGSVGDRNILIGDSCSTNQNRGYGNVIIGAQALSTSSALGDTNVIISPRLTNPGGGFTNNNIVLGANFRSTSTLSNVTIIGAGMTNDVNNVVRLGRDDQNVIMGSTASIANNGFRLQVRGAGYIMDSLKIDNIPTGSVTDSLLVKRNNVVYNIPHTEFSGTYTPTLTNGTNVAASTAYPCQYMRVGNVVTVSGKVDIDPTAVGATTLGVSLPIASSLGNDYEAGGTTSAGLESFVGSIKADPTNDRVQIDFVIPTLGSISNTSWYFTFTYQIL